MQPRTHTCGALRAEHAGQTVTLHGWVSGLRDKKTIFVVLRDRYGTVQVTLDEQCSDALMAIGKQLALEYTVEVQGVVRLRYAPNDKMETGAIEIEPTSIEILSTTKPLPFKIDDLHAQASEEVRLKYRYLDLRQSRLQQTMRIRHKTALVVRNYLDEQGFYEIETPILNRSTPEGARDYLVPSRVHPGQWYALPQSPQIFKQILMIGGMDRYFQLCRCFRDEDLRADRQPEFTQIDIEMSFVMQEMIIELSNGMIRKVWKDVIGVEVGDIPSITYAEAIERFGVDNPDLRFGMELFTADWKGTEFGVIGSALEQGGVARGFVVKGGADVSTALFKTHKKKGDGDWLGFVKKYRLGGLLYGKLENGEWTGPLSKVESTFLSTIEGVEEGDLVLLGAGPANHVNTAMGRLRAHVARQRDLIPEGAFAFVWVTDFPAFEHDEDSDRWVSVHHPFTKPIDAHIPWLGTERMGDILSDAYDIVCNGYEIGGGSIRIHNSTVQAKVFEALGLSEAEAKNKFGFLIDALQYGAPPHGGLAMGFDRWTMLLSGTENIRDVIAFPKTAKAQDLMAEAPNTVATEQLNELFVANTVEQEEDSSSDSE
jgi:aspartyl-tRNA synthetase